MPNDFGVIHLDQKEVFKNITITVEVQKRHWLDLRLRVAVLLVRLAGAISPIQVEIK